MANYNALEALINAYIKQNGVKAITGQVLNGVLRGMVSALGKGWTIAEGDARPDTDPGTMTGPVAYVAHTAGTYTNFGGLVVNEGEVALLKYNEQTWTKEVLASLAANATIDGNVGTPAVGVSFVNGVLTFDFRNMKGNPGDSAGFGTVNATVDGTIGTPGVTVQASGPDTAKNFTFAFTGLKGETGVTSVVASVDNTTGNPSCSVSLVGQELHLDFTGLKGAQGDTGVSADYPIAIVNNLTTNDPASALSAAQGVVLDGKVSQLEAKVDGNEFALFNEGKLSPKIINNSYVDNNTGEFLTYNNWSRTDYINVRPFTKVKVTAVHESIYGAVYDADKTRIEQFSLVNGTKVLDVTGDIHYLCVSDSTSYLTQVTFEIDGYKVDALSERTSVLENKVADIEDDIIVGPDIQYSPVIVPGLQCKATGIAASADHILYYVPIRAGQTIVGEWIFASGYVQYGLTRNIPATGESVISQGAGGTGTTTASFTAQENGFFCASFGTAPTSISFYSPHNGIGKDVYVLQEELEDIHKEVEIVGRGTTAVSTDIPITPGRYRIVIDNFVSGDDRISYIIFQISVGERVIAKYYGNGIVPNVFYFDVESGEDNINIYSRAENVSTFIVNISKSKQSGIFDYNEYGKEVYRLLNAKKRFPTTTPFPFVLLHFSDIHADSVRLKRIIQYRRAFKAGIDDFIHTGDAVGNKANATTFDFWDECGATPVLNCIGNHDVWYEDGFTPEENFAYNTYIKPYVGTEWGDVIQPTGAEENGLCYYYKDYANSGVRLVVLDYRNPSGMGGWFESVLSDAKTNSLAVIVAMHYIPKWTMGFHNNFDLSSFVPIGTTMAGTMADYVDAFIADGGTFVCWLVGHSHNDFCGYYENSGRKQVIVCVDCAAMRNDTPFRFRGENSKSQDAFNVVSVNTASHLLSIFRVGNDMDSLQRHIGSMCIKYDTAELISSE